jgi:predicted permease
MDRRVATSWRLTLRRAWKRPVESLLAISALGLGIGISTAMACILQGVLAPPSPSSASDRLISIRVDGSGEPAVADLSLEELRAWQHGVRGLSAICGWSRVGEIFSGDGVSAEEENGAFVSSDFFRVIGTWPALGRAFRADEDRPGARSVVVIGDALWRRRYRSDPRVVGRTVLLGGGSREIIGVMPPGSRLPADGDFWQPLGAVDGPAGQISGLAALREGVQLAQVRHELMLISDQVIKTSTLGGGNARRLIVLPFAFAYARSSGAVLGMLSVAALAVLLIACANVAVLLLLRTGLRRHELAVRAALGGRPSSIFWLALSEVMILALGGGAAGLLVAAVCLHLYRATGGLVQASWIATQLDARALLPLIAAVIVVTAVAGVGPALYASRVSPSELLKVNPAESGPFRSRSAARWCLVSFELCLSSALLVCAFQMIQSVHDLFAFDLGVKPEQVWTALLALDLREHRTPASRMSFLRELSAATQELPGVTAVAYANYQVAGPTPPPTNIEFEHAAPGSAANSTRWSVISEGFLATLGRHVIKGRDFSGEDRRPTAPVVIVNESFARRFFKGDPLGRRIRLAGEGARWAGEGDPAPWRTIVGVAPDLYLAWDDYGSIVDSRHVEGIYLPMSQRDVFGMEIIVRTVGVPASFARNFRTLLQRVAPSTPPEDPGTLAQRLTQATVRHRLLRGLLTVFALAALVLTGISLYGLVSFLAARRRREIAIRMSLGARRLDVMALVAREATLQLLMGSVAGLAISAGLARSFSSLLIGVSALDWRLAVSVVALLAGVTVVACLSPVRQAIRLDPMANLRIE